MVIFKYLSLTLLFLSANTHAIDGTIVVLEAPLFKTPDEASKVVQYYRKGETIFIHSMEAFHDYFEDEEIVQVRGIKADPNTDPFIGEGQVYYPNPESKFYKTVSRNGSEAFILKEHVYIVYKDKREFSQKVIEHDHTDYRIAEPIPKKYPFIQESGYRGQTQLAFGQPNYKVYPFPDQIRDTEISTSKELNFVWSSAESVDSRKRFFFGFMAGFHFSSIKFLLSQQEANQENTRFSLGPFASYDVYRSKKGAFNIYTSSQAYLYDSMKITATNKLSNIKETREYASPIGLTQLLGFNYQFFKSIYTFDTIIGTNIRLNLPKNYSTTSAADTEDLWNSSSKTDNYDQPFSTEVSLFVGLQSYY
jgi:hypothetical protein